MKHKLFSFSAILAAFLSLTACGPGESITDVNYSEIAASDGSLVFTTSSTPEISTEPSVEPIIPSAEISEETSDVTVTEATTTTTMTETSVTVPAPEPSEYQELKVHFLDVGQGDSCFIELPNKETMLIDAGESEYGDSIVTYIYGQGYDTLDYVVATHPHADHIGGMADVLNTFNIRNFYATAFTTTTQTYERMLDAVENSGAAVHEVMAGSVILDEPELLVEVVAPKTLSDDSNNSSVVIKLTYGENKFLFTGDAEKSEEDDIWTNIKCDVLKVGHHGSATSSSANFLKKVDPTYAVISCGMGNKYGHPTDEVLERLNSRNIEVFRTDLQGTIVFTSDGKNISVDKQPSAYQTSVQTTATTTQTTGPSFACRFRIGQLGVFSDKASAPQLFDTDTTECRVRAVEQPFDLRFIVFHRFDELPDIDALPGAQRPQGQSECRRGLAFAVTGVNVYIAFSLHS